MRVSDIVDLRTYPIHDLESAAGKDLIRHIRQELEEDGSCVLPGFVHRSALTRLASEARELYDLAYAGPTAVTPYYFNYALGEAHTGDPEHPTQRKGRRNLKQVAADLIPGEHTLSRLYFSEEMPAFLGAVLGTTVYRNQDRYQSLNINFQNAGGCQQWHFDTAQMVTTLLLQAPEKGGVFEYCPEIRSEESENFESVRSVLDGDLSRVKSLQLEAGMLSLFQGRYSMHRVTEVGGDTQRIQAILGYATRPGLTGSIESSILHYGPRVAVVEKSLTQGRQV